jgi:hypothetical protein
MKLDPDTLSVVRIHGSEQVRAKTLRIRNTEHSKIDVFPSSLCMVRYEYLVFLRG